MKSHLLGFLAIATITITSPLMLIDNFSKNKKTTTLQATTLNHKLYDKYHSVRISSEYSRMTSDFKDLKWHAQNWGLSAVPIYGFIFYGDFVKYYNRMIESMTKIIVKNETLNINGLKKQSGLKIFSAVVTGVIGLVSSSEELQSYFWRYIEPQYQYIVSFVSKN